MSNQSRIGAAKNKGSSEILFGKVITNFMVIIIDGVKSEKVIRQLITSVEIN